MPKPKFAVVIPCSGDILAVCESVQIQLRKDFQLSSLTERSPYPHITLCSGTLQNSIEQISTNLSAITDVIKPFNIKPNGWGWWFNADNMDTKKLLHLRWQCSSNLLNVFRLVGNFYTDNIGKVDTHYFLGTWQVKTTLAYEQIDNPTVGEIMQSLPSTLPESMQVTQLALIQLDDNQQQHIKFLTLDANQPN